MNPFRRNSSRAALSVVVAGAVLAAAACGGEASVSSPDEAANTPPSAVATAMDTLMRQGFPGVQVVIDGPAGHRTFTAGVGDLNTRAPFPDDARVRIGSNTKTYVATVIMQLVAEGKVDLDAPIERYLPGVVQGNGNDGSIPGFETRNGVRADGTAVTVTVNQLPTTEEETDAVLGVLDAALCTA
ncbi:serine hydrolase domain-containing protein [Nocardia shimofusensis]|uniref:serine hydrolase domain-containing protein n=1 Tax=Nocardia shimofusensis TaxID=228596 RepID=UPI0012ED770A|nr:serine hydrolase domain-containing protein [Nocardia shimofusensis]